ncbi:MAG: tandem-95 repeat protein [Dehalococcoidia bacterium]|nr:MAG: tandem-95 repeat protein [Dehalococcoidia bacterium]
MRKKLLSMLVLSILVSLALVGCDGGGGSQCPSTLTILSITEGDVSVMKEGTDDWVGAVSEMELEIGDAIKTGDDSGAEITFFDGSTMEMEAGTEIEILSLDLACDTGVTTITLEQTIGTTISRVTKLLDPASSYEIETPTGVAGVRGSTMIVTVGGNGTTLITNEEGNIYAIGEGVELPIPEGRTGIIASGQEPELVNNPPVAEDDAATTDEDNPVTVAAPGVLSNDSDPDVGDTLTVTALDTSGTVGAVNAWDADGSFAYNPDGQFEYLQAGSSTTDSFTYTVSDSDGGTDTATVTITVNGVNDPPVAVNDSAITDEDTPVIIDVLDNDSDVDGDTLTVDSVTQGANGSVINNGGNVTYTPALNFTGIDSFTYTISDGNGGTDTATVTVNVTVTETPATINVQIDTGPTASIFIWDDTTDGWATDVDTQELVDGTNHVTSNTIAVAAGHYYYVWVEAEGTVYYVKNWPKAKDWIITSAPVGDAGAAYGYAAAGSNYPVHFGEIT